MKEEQKILTQEEFRAILNQTSDMIEDAFQRPVSADSMVLESFIKTSKLSDEQWSYILTKAPAFHVFPDVDGCYLKTPQKTIEKVEPYLKRLVGDLIAGSKALAVYDNAGFLKMQGFSFKALLRDLIRRKNTLVGNTTRYIRRNYLVKWVSKRFKKGN